LLCLPQSPLPTSYQHYACFSWFSTCWPFPLEFPPSSSHSYNVFKSNLKTDFFSSSQNASGTTHGTSVYRQSAPFGLCRVWKSSKSSPLTPSHCGNFMSRAQRYQVLSVLFYVCLLNVMLDWQEVLKKLSWPHWEIWPRFSSRLTDEYDCTADVNVTWNLPHPAQRIINPCA